MTRKTTKTMMTTQPWNNNNNNNNNNNSSSRSSNSRSRMLAVVAVLLLLLPPPASPSIITSKQDFSKLEVVEGKAVKMPCYVPKKDDPLRMILWRKGENNIYVLKVKSNMVWAEASIGSRATFVNEEGEQPHLLLESVASSDSGLYKCEAQYYASRSEVHISRLNVIVLPGIVNILKEDGTEVMGTLGPYSEGDNITFTCQVLGGVPSPQVTWYEGAKLLKGQVERGDGEVRNTLTLGPLTRDHLDAFLSCQASNTKLVTPVNRAVKLDVNYKPLTVEIEGQEALVARQENQMTCRSRGGRPPALLTWDLRGENLTGLAVQQTEMSGNVSVSILTFEPSLEDSGETLVCRAQSPVIQHEPIVDVWVLNVQYAPVLNLTLTSPRNLTDVREGDNVTFVCQVSANPPVANVTWYHKGLPLKLNATEGVTAEGFNLNLKNVRRQQVGVYTCIASNAIGDGTSQMVMLDVKYRPLCAHPEVQSIGVALSHKVNLTCEMKAPQGTLIFKWNVNITGNLMPLQPQEYTKQGRTSVLHYTVVDKDNYGTVLCYAGNEMGETMEPCKFEIIPAGKPDSLKNCTVTNQTTDTLFVSCLPGYNGGLSQHYVVQVYEYVDGGNETGFLHNVTELVEPTFALDGLRSDGSYLLYLFSENVKGRSEKRILHAFTLPPPPPSEPPFYIFPITPILGVLIGVVGAMVLVAIVVVVVMKLRGDARREMEEQQQAGQGEGHDSKMLMMPPPTHAHTPLSPHKDGEDDGPDVIHCRADPAYEDVDGIPQKLKHVNIYETVPYDKEPSGRKSESSDTGDVEYAELTFSNGKSKNKKNKKKSKSHGANGTIRSEDDDSTIYAVIDHARTAQQTPQQAAQQQQQQRNNKAGKQQQALGGGNSSVDSSPQRQPDEIPLMHATLESSV